MCYGHYSLPGFEQTIMSGRAGMTEKDRFSSQQKTWKTKTSSIIHLQPQKDFVASKAELSCCQDKVCSSFYWMLYNPPDPYDTDQQQAQQKCFHRSQSNMAPAGTQCPPLITDGKSNLDLLHTHIFSRACRKGKALT